MTPESQKELKNLLIDDEGYSEFVYTDTTGHLTIGIGRNISKCGISFDEAMFLLENDIYECIVNLTNDIDLFENLDDARKIVLINMCFNLGINGILKFINMIKALNNKDYVLASFNILESKAAKENPKRYVRLAHIMRTGELNGF